MNKLIFGYGVTGKAVEAFYNKKNIPYKIFDENSTENYDNEIFKDQIFKEDFDEVILSPGINESNETLKLIRSKGLRVITDIWYKWKNNLCTITKQISK